MISVKRAIDLIALFIGCAKSMNGSQEVVAIGSAGMTNMKAKMPDRVETLDELKDRLETLFTDSTIDMNAFRTHQLSFVVPGTPKSVISQLSRTTDAANQSRPAIT